MFNLWFRNSHGLKCYCKRNFFYVSDRDNFPVMVFCGLDYLSNNGGEIPRSFLQRKLRNRDLEKTLHIGGSLWDFHLLKPFTSVRILVKSLWGARFWSTPVWSNQAAFALSELGPKAMFGASLNILPSSTILGYWKITCCELLNVSVHSRQSGDVQSEMMRIILITIVFRKELRQVIIKFSVN